MADNYQTLECPKCRYRVGVLQGVKASGRHMTCGKDMKPVRGKAGTKR